jgi:hypothetical protein
MLPKVRRQRARAKRLSSFEERCARSLRIERSAPN